MAADVVNFPAERAARLRDKLDRQAEQAATIGGHVGVKCPTPHCGGFAYNLLAVESDDGFSDLRATCTRCQVHHPLIAIIRKG